MIHGDLEIIVDSKFLNIPGRVNLISKHADGNPGKSRTRLSFYWLELVMRPGYLVRASPLPLAASSSAGMYVQSSISFGDLRIKLPGTSPIRQCSMIRLVGRIFRGLDTLSCNTCPSPTQYRDSTSFQGKRAVAGPGADGPELFCDWLL